MCRWNTSFPGRRSWARRDWAGAVYRRSRSSDRAAQRGSAASSSCSPCPAFYENNRGYDINRYHSYLKDDARDDPNTGPVTIAGSQGDDFFDLINEGGATSLDAGAGLEHKESRLKWTVIEKNHFGHSQLNIGHGTEHRVGLAQRAVGQADAQVGRPQVGGQLLVVADGHLAGAERRMDQRRERLDVGAHDDHVPRLEGRVLQPREQQRHRLRPQLPQRLGDDGQARCEEESGSEDDANEAE